MIIAGACSAVAALALASTANAITSEGVEVSLNGGAFTQLADAGTINPVTDNGPGDLNLQTGVIRAVFNFDGLTISTSGNDAFDTTAYHVRGIARVEGAASRKLTMDGWRTSTIAKVA